MAHRPPPSKEEESPQAINKKALGYPAARPEPMQPRPEKGAPQVPPTAIRPKNRLLDSSVKTNQAIQRQ